MAHRIGDLHKYDWDGAGLPQQRDDRGTCHGQDYVWLEIDQLFCKILYPIDLASCPTIIDPNVAALYPSQLAETLPERRNRRLPFGIALSIARQQADPSHALGLLCASGERVYGDRTTEKRDEITSLHLPRFALCKAQSLPLCDRGACGEMAHNRIQTR